MKKPTDAEIIADAMHFCLISPNEADSNGEAANIVDALAKIGRGLYAVARAIDRSTLAQLGGSQRLQQELEKRAFE